jgi:hypothetical protein
MTFQYCATCRRQRRKSKAYDSDAWDPCNECFERRQKYIDQLHRDRAYRSHLARQIAGYPCDTKSKCPHHPDDYQYFKYPRISFVENGYAELVKTAFAKLRRSRESDITALELLSAHYASLAGYCQTCYGNALDGFEDNADVGLCQNCHGKRSEFIKDNHGHHTEFKLPLEWPRGFSNDDYYPPLLHIDQDPADGEECEADDYFEKYFLCPLGWPRDFVASLPDAAVVFGNEATLGTYAAIETAVHLARAARQQQWWNEREISDTEWPRL